MAINLKKICDDLNKLPGLPEDLEFVVKFVEQEIWIRQKIKYPFRVMTRHQIEENFDKPLAEAAILFVNGGVMEFDPGKVMQEWLDYNVNVRGRK